MNQGYRGKSYYQVDYYDGRHLLLVAIECKIGEPATRTNALLDTGSQWCMLPAELAQDLGLDLEPDPSVPRLHSRFGTIQGRLERLTLTFQAEEGEDFEVEATWFVSADWTGPTVIGWKGCLERFRFGLDPTQDAFYFGE